MERVFSGIQFRGELEVRQTRELSDAKTATLEGLVDDEGLRAEIDRINLQILELLSRGGELVCEIGRISSTQSDRTFDPEGEQGMLDRLIQANRGPYPNGFIAHLFKEIFKASLNLEHNHSPLLSSRVGHPEGTVVCVKGIAIGSDVPAVIAGPCSVESEEQIRLIAQEVKDQGVWVLRGGAFKPRTSPYTFQGLGKEALIYLAQVSAELGLVTVCEVMDTRDVDLVAEHVDILQVGSRNMSNFALLKEVGRRDYPVLLKRGMAATIEEFLYAAEYVLSEGNTQVILCERGIRTFETWSRNTLDITAIAILKQKTHLPIIADISHSAGRRDLALPLAKACLAAGADGIMVEVHNAPELALSDKEQQLNFDEFRHLMTNIQPMLS